MVKRFIDPDRLPLTYEAIQEERAFDAAQAKSGGQLKRIASGFVVAGPGVIRHFSDSVDMRAHVFNGGDDHDSCNRPTAAAMTIWDTPAPPEPENPTVARPDAPVAHL